MNPQDETVIDGLKAQLLPIAPDDTMAEAGRKALLSDLIKMLEHEAGSRSGQDIEDVHDMRVATRRMRSTLRLLAPYFKPKAVDPIQKQLRKLARALGEVRDLDVLIDNVAKFQETLEQDRRDELQPLFSELEQQRAEARHRLIKMLDKKSYQRFVDDYAAFLTKSGKGAVVVDTEDLRPYQVRHLLPTLIFAHLGAVRAYDGVIEEANDETLHALRIEFKRLRYAVTVFADVLGTSSAEFIDELKAIQDHLGEITDIRVAQERFSEMSDELDPESQAETLYALQQYVEQMEANRAELRASVSDVWRHFNTKTVQRLLATALAGM